MNFYYKLENGIGRVTRALASVCLMVVFALFLLNILTRASFFTWNPTWIDEVIQFFLVWMIFLAAAELVRTGEHFMVDIIVDKLHGRALGRWFRLAAVIIMLITYAVILYFGVKHCLRMNVKVTFTLPAFIKMSWFYSCIPLTALLMLLYSVRDLYRAVKDLITRGGVTAQMDALRAQALEHDEDARAIAAAREALSRDRPAD